MTALVIAEHDNATIKGATLNTVTAAVACGGDGVERRALEQRVFVFGNDEDPHLRSPSLRS